MRGPTAGLLIGAGALVLVALVFLQRAISSSEPAASPPPARTAEPAPAIEVAPAPAPAAPAQPAARIAKLAPLLSGRSSEPASASAAPVLETDPSEPPGKPQRIASLVDIRVQISAVEPKINECLARSRGARSGAATLMFIVAPKDKESKTVIEAPSIEHDDTTIDDPQLVECMRDTALAMHFAYAQGGQAVAAKRKVVIENGKLVSDELVESRRIRN
jgi:hypothetical protein